MLNQFAQAPDDFFVNLLNSITNNNGLASSGDIIASTSSSTLTITGLKTGSEVRVYRSSDLEELTGIENSENTFSWGFSVTGTVTVEIAILHLEYQYMRLYDIILHLVMLQYLFNKLKIEITIIQHNYKLLI